MNIDSAVKWFRDVTDQVLQAGGVKYEPKRKTPGYYNIPEGETFYQVGCFSAVDTGGVPLETQTFMVDMKNWDEWETKFLNSVIKPSIDMILVQARTSLEASAQKDVKELTCVQRFIDFGVIDDEILSIVAGFVFTSEHSSPAESPFGSALEDILTNDPMKEE
jgi:hypothetical protein